MEIQAHARVEARASLRFSPASSGPIVTTTDRKGEPVQRRLVSLTVLLDEEGVDFSGYGYKIKKNGEVGEQASTVSSLDPAELPEGARSALVNAATEALDAAIAAR